MPFSCSRDSLFVRYFANHRCKSRERGRGIWKKINSKNATKQLVSFIFSPKLSVCFKLSNKIFNCFNQPTRLLIVSINLLVYFSIFCAISESIFIILNLKHINHFNLFTKYFSCFNQSTKLLVLYKIIFEFFSFS